MAVTVTSQILEQGPRYAVLKFTGVSTDGTEESGVTKVNATSSGSLGVIVQGQTFYPGVNLKVVDIWWDVASWLLRVQWHATSNVDMLALHGWGHWKYINQRNGFGGLYVPSGTTGATGSIDFLTQGAIASPAAGSPASSYTVIMTVTKGIPQT